MVDVRMLKLKPMSQKLMGNGLSVFVSNVPISPITRRIINKGTFIKDGRFRTFPRALPKSRFLIGFGAQKLTGPFISSFSIIKLIAEIRSFI